MEKKQPAILGYPAISTKRVILKTRECVLGQVKWQTERVTGRANLHRQASATNSEKYNTQRDGWINRQRYK